MSLNIKKNVILSSYTTYKIGGPAKYFCEVKNAEEAARAIEWAREDKIPYFVLGGGSNILVSDKGFDGLVIKISDSGFRVSPSSSDVATRRMTGSNFSIEAGAGIDLQKLVLISINQGLKGLEWASGIPGTLGGAIRGNAGAFGGEMKDIIKSVRFLDENLRVGTFNNKQCEFFYRDSVFKKNSNFLILSAEIKFKKGDKDKLKKKSEEIIKFRKSRHPLEYGSCGSVFKAVDVSSLKLKNFEKYPKFKESIKNDPFPVIPIASFIDEAGLKGYRIGGAMISEKHPNFLINFENAKAEEIMSLISFVKQRLISEFGIIPEEEVQYIGWPS